MRTALTVAALSLLLLSGCIKTTPSDEAGEEQSWQETTDVVLETGDFPPEHDWIVVEVETTQPRSPYMTFDGAWQSRYTSVFEGFDPTGENRDVCLTIWQVAGPDSLGHLLLVAPAFSSGVMIQEDGITHDQRFNTTENGIHLNIQAFGNQPMAEDGRAYFLLAFNLVQNPHPLDEISWRFHDEEPFRWRIAASGKMQCGFGPHDFSEGDYRSVDSGVATYMEADGLRQELEFSGAGFLWFGAKASTAYEAAAVRDGETQWTGQYEGGLRNFSESMAHWWTPEPADWSLQVDRMRDVNGNGATAFVAIDGVPPHMAQRILDQES